MAGSEGIRYSPVHPDDFKGALASWAAGVTIVTTRHEDLVYGITVSSFSSLSLDPLLVLACLQNTGRLQQMIRESGRFAVSVLADDQEAVSQWFSRGGREPVPAFEEFGTIEMTTGSPIIAGAVAHLDCELEQAVPGGDHTIIIGRVVGAASDPTRRPLLYFRRAYRRLAEDPL
jgi:flavin reductase (DIM6/NTAB) family NADH-FMN oxidoreductase RutF